MKNRDKILSEAQALIPEVPGIYKHFLRMDLELCLFELAQQANSSLSERAGAEKAVGTKMIQLALQLFPTAKVGDKFVQGCE